MKIQSFTYNLKTGWNSDLTSASHLDSENTVVFIFGASDFKDKPAPFDEIKRVLPKSTLIGCSGSGEIFGDRVSDQSLAVAVVRFERSKIRAAWMEISDMNQSFEVGKRLASALADSDLTGAFVLSDGLLVNGSELAQGINSVLPSKSVTGGLAGDGSRFKETWVLKAGKPQSGLVSAIGFYGNRITIGHGSLGGWDIFGPERVVTKSKGNILYELDGEPALALYKQYLGEQASGLPATALLFPLQIKAANDEKKKLVRTILAVNEKEQSMTFAGNIPQGTTAQLMRANFDRLIEGAARAAELSKSSRESGPLFAIAVSCVGRRLVLGERTYEEVEATLNKLPQGSVQIGYYSYGELSPQIENGFCELHNQTMTMTTFSELDLL